MNALDLAAGLVGSKKLLAEKLGVTQSALSQWTLKGRKIPAEYCPIIERLTKGQVICEDLRPDMEWHVILGRAAETARTARTRHTDSPQHQEERHA